MIKEMPYCPVEMTLLLIGDHWKVLILYDLMTGIKRFGTSEKHVYNGGVSIRNN